VTASQSENALSGASVGDKSVSAAAPRQRQGGTSAQSAVTKAKIHPSSEVTKDSDEGGSTEKTVFGGVNPSPDPKRSTRQTSSGRLKSGVNVESASMSATTSPSADEETALEGQILFSASASYSGMAPANNQDLILRMWNSLTWNKAGQVSLIIVVVGIAAALLFLWLGQLAHTLIGTPTTWSAFGGIAAGGSAGAVTYNVSRRRQRRDQRSRQEADQVVE